MAWELPDEPFQDREPGSPIETVVVPRSRDLGDDFHVLRALPSARRRMVGPFIFFDQMGPTTLAPGKGLDVRPHPHIGLATVTYLFSGEILHRDTLGNVQRIRPGAVNWMTAGRGIAHSERSPPGLRASGGPLFGIQLWVALPKALEECAPSFVHTGASELPRVSDAGLEARVILGAQFGARSPVKTASEMFYADVRMDAGTSLPLECVHEERADFVAEGAIEVDGESFPQGRFIVFRPRAELTLRARVPARLMLLGGEPLDGPRHIYWNFVSSAKERIEQAKADWRAQRFGAISEEHDFIPLPDEAPVAKYP